MQYQPVHAWVKVQYFINYKSATGFLSTFKDTYVRCLQITKLYIYISIDNGALGVCHDNVLFVYADIRIHILNCKNFKQTPQKQAFLAIRGQWQTKGKFVKKKGEKEKWNHCAYPNNNSLN